MISRFNFSEVSPNAAGTSVSSQPVQNAASYLPTGVAGPLDDCTGIQVTAQLVGATGGTLNVYLQTSPNDGGAWFDQVHFAQLAAGAAAVTYSLNLTPYATASAAPVAVGSGTTPALAAGTVVPGLGFNRARLVMVAGSGTTAGAAVAVTLVCQRAGTRR